MTPHEVNAKYGGFSSYLTPNKISRNARYCQSTGKENTRTQIAVWQTTDFADSPIPQSQTGEIKEKRSNVWDRASHECCNSGCRIDAQHRVPQF